jgi:integrase
MATIVRRPGPRGRRYQVRIRMGSRAQSATFSSMREARHWATATEAAWADARAGALPWTLQLTVGDLLRRYGREVVPQKPPATAQNYAIYLAWWQEQLGAVRLRALGPAQLTACRDRLAATRQAATVNRYLAMLSHACTLASAEWQWLERNPLQGVRRLPEPRGRVRYLSDEERTRLLEACQQSGNRFLYPAVVLALSTGARKMELLSLTWNDVDWLQRQLIFRETKNDEPRAVPLGAKAFEAVAELSRVRRIDTPLVFPRRDGLKPIDLRRAWYTALERASVEDFHWHDLRHSAGSYLAMAGCSPREIAEVLGHKSLQMSFKYQHLAPQHTRAVVVKLNTAMFGGGTP